MEADVEKLMKTMTAIVTCLVTVFGVGAVIGQAERALARPSKHLPSEPSAKHTAPALPPLPAGLTELKFSEFFVSPVGDRGLTLTDKLQSLDGKRVRILGYMAQQEKPVPGMFLFSAFPVRLNEEHYGLADDLPAATCFVSMPKNRDRVVTHTTQLMLLSGTLSVGNREEPDGRISTVRLALEVPEAGAKKRVNSNQSSGISNQSPGIRRAK